MSLIHRSTGIIISTVEAIHELGFHNISTKEIAKRQGVSEGTLYRHFKSKDAILLGVLEHYSQYDDDIIQSCLNRKLDPIMMIKDFIHSYVEYYENYPEITSIVQSYDSFMAYPLLADKIRCIKEKRRSFIQERIEEAKTHEYIVNSVDSKLLTSLIMGGTREICLEWRMNSYSFSLKQRTISMIDQLLDAFTEKHKGGNVL